MSGFSDEAFGLTRTLVDIYFTLRFISNKDPDERAKQYARFAAKDSAVWEDLARTYWPQNARSLDEHTKRMAAAYPSPHRWSGRTARDMATEPDTVETDPATGQPAVSEFDYAVIYRWTSHYVHPSIAALRHHLVQAGHDNFVIRGGSAPDMTHLTLFNVATFVGKTMIHFYRCMRDPQPERISKWAKGLIEHLARRHR